LPHARIQNSAISATGEAAALGRQQMAALVYVGRKRASLNNPHESVSSKKNKSTASSAPRSALCHGSSLCATLRHLAKTLRHNIQGRGGARYGSSFSP